MTALSQSAMSDRWPWPADSKEDRLRRIIDHYRQGLADIDLEACLVLDKKMADYGQPWISDNSIVDVNAMLSAKDVAERFGLSEWNVRDWARRNPDKIRRNKAAKGRTLFRLGDVLTYSANK